MLTIIETEAFEKLWPIYWTENEHDAFTEFIAENPNAGVLTANKNRVNLAAKPNFD